MQVKRASPGYLLPVPSKEAAALSHCHRVNDAQQLLDRSVFCKQLVGLHILHDADLTFSHGMEQHKPWILASSYQLVAHLLVGGRQICVAGPGVQHDARHILFAASKL